jgi:hypothetical protein
MTTPIPRPISGNLRVYLAQDSNLWALNQADGSAYQVSGAGSGGPTGVPEAPTDGNLYGRENAAWAVVPPSGVQKAGDTMSGQLIVKGDQFDQNITPSPTPALLIENSSGGDQIGIAVGEFGDSITFVKANGQQANIRSQGILVMGSGNPNIQISSGMFGMTSPGSAHCNITAMDNGAISLNTGAVGAGMQLNDSVVVGAIHWNAGGDLIVTQTTGPNAGKSVNLTAGKWA